MVARRSHVAALMSLHTSVRNAHNKLPQVETWTVSRHPSSLKVRENRHLQAGILVCGLTRDVPWEGCAFRYLRRDIPWDGRALEYIRRDIP